MTGWHKYLASRLTNQANQAELELFDKKCRDMTSHNTIYITTYTSVTLTDIFCAPKDVYTCSYYKINLPVNMKKLTATDNKSVGDIVEKKRKRRNGKFSFNKEE